MRYNGHFRRSRSERITLDALPQPVPIAYKGFRGGYDARDRREDVNENSSPDCSDFEVTEHDTLIRQAGISTNESFTGRTILGMVPHVSLDRKTELVLFDPPSLGIKTTGATVWTDHGLQDTGRFAAGLHGEDLIFTDGISTYLRRPRTAPEVIEGAPIAKAYASFAGRVFALNVYFGGVRESIGIVWSGSSAQPTDWTGLGSGYELLIQETQAGDYGVALLAMNMDFMAIMLRRSIWIGRATRVANRPAHFEPRIRGVGAVNSRVCQSTPVGVVFLSDTGVRVFDGNQAQVVSQAINDRILPLDYDQIESYSSLYDAQASRYYLHTPTETWILDLEQLRWYRKSLVAQHSSVFAEQAPIVTWESLAGQTWEALAGNRWDDYARQENVSAPPHFLSTIAGVPTLGVADPTLETYFGAVVVPHWEFHRAEGVPQNQVITYRSIQIEYQGYGTLRIKVPDIDGNMSLAVTEVLGNLTDPRIADIPLMRSGKGAGLRLEVTAGFPEVFSAAQMVLPRSVSKKLLPFAAREYHEEF